MSYKMHFTTLLFILVSILVVKVKPRMVYRRDLNKQHGSENDKTFNDHINLDEENDMVHQSIIKSQNSKDKLLESNQHTEFDNEHFDLKHSKVASLSYSDLVHNLDNILDISVLDISTLNRTVNKTKSEDFDKDNLTVKSNDIQNDLLIQKEKNMDNESEVDASLLNNILSPIKDIDTLSLSEQFVMNEKHKSMINSKTAKNSLLDSDQDNETNDINTVDSDSSSMFISPKHKSMIIRNPGNKPISETISDVVNPTEQVGSGNNSTTSSNDDLKIKNFEQSENKKTDTTAEVDDSSTPNIFVQDKDTDGTGLDEGSVLLGTDGTGLPNADGPGMSDDDGPLVLGTDGIGIPNADGLVMPGSSETGIFNADSPVVPNADRTGTPNDDGPVIPVTGGPVKDIDSMSHNDQFIMNEKHKSMINIQTAKKSLLDSDQDIETNEINTVDSDSSSMFINPKHKSMIIRKPGNKPISETISDVVNPTEQVGFVNNSTTSSKDDLDIKTPNDGPVMPNTDGPGMPNNDGPVILGTDGTGIPNADGPAMPVTIGTGIFNSDGPVMPSAGGPGMLNDDDGPLMFITNKTGIPNVDRTGSHNADGPVIPGTGGTGIPNTNGSRMSNANGIVIPNDDGPVTPNDDRPVTPATSGTGILVTVQPGISNANGTVMSGTSGTGIPVTVQPGMLNDNGTVMPGTSGTGIPVSVQPVMPNANGAVMLGTSGTGIPVTVQPGMPNANGTVMPSTNVTGIPVTVQPEMPNAIGTGMPGTSGTGIPVNVHQGMPNANGTVMPGTSGTGIPVVQPGMLNANGTVMPGTSGTGIPITVQPGMHTANKQLMPGTSGTGIPVTVQSGMPTANKQLMPDTSGTGIPVTVQPGMPLHVGSNHIDKAVHNSANSIHPNGICKGEFARGTANGRCVFPFDFGGGRFCDCPSTYFLMINTPWTWCPTNVIDRIIKEWDYCTHTLTVKGNKCVFPFTFNNKIYNDCTMGTVQDHHWCATTLKPDGKTVDTWELCNSADKES